MKLTIPVFFIHSSEKIIVDCPQWSLNTLKQNRPWNVAIILNLIFQLFCANKIASIM